MELELVQVDAFTQEIFGGNSAAVIILNEWLSDDLLQKIARENNLSETVYVIRKDDSFLIRWFTPSVEVDLCGHATLAAAYVIFKDGMVASDKILLKSTTEMLSVARNGERLQLDFPSRPGVQVSKLMPLESALNVKIQDAYQARDTLVVLENQQQIENLQPDFNAISQLETFAIVVTAPGDDCDFVSRFFAPGAGISEDPVTGSAHCTLVPYWAKRLGKPELHARQLSERRGELFCKLAGERVFIGGYCREYMRGHIFI